MLLLLLRCRLPLRSSGSAMCSAIIAKSLNIEQLQKKCTKSRILHTVLWGHLDFFFPFVLKSFILLNYGIRFRCCCSASPIPRTESPQSMYFEKEYKKKKRWSEKRNRKTKNEKKKKKNETHEHNPLKYRIPHGFRACFLVVLQSFNMFRWFLYSLPKRGVLRESTMHANCGKKTGKNRPPFSCLFRNGSVSGKKWKWECVSMNWWWSHVPSAGTTYVVMPMCECLLPPSLAYKRNVCRFLKNGILRPSTIPHFISCTRHISNLYISDDENSFFDTKPKWLEWMKIRRKMQE